MDKLVHYVVKDISACCLHLTSIPKLPDMLSWRCVHCLYAQLKLFFPINPQVTFDQNHHHNE